MFGPLESALPRFLWGRDTLPWPVAQVSDEAPMKKRIEQAWHIAAACLLVGALSAPAQAAKSDLMVTLWDSGPDAEMSMDRGIGMDHAGMSDAKMGIKLSAATVDAGEVTFKVVNTSKETVHEMLVVPLPADGKPLPYDEKEAKFDEDKAGALGEVEELEAGKSGELTLHLKPGKYVLSCNVANHYANGMWTILTVK